MARAPSTATKTTFLRNTSLKDYSFYCSKKAYPRFQVIFALIFTPCINCRFYLLTRFSIRPKSGRSMRLATVICLRGGYEAEDHAQIVSEKFLEHRAILDQEYGLRMFSSTKLPNKF
jgi:hypothetical protein